MQRYFDVEGDSFLYKKSFHLTILGGILVFILDIITPRGAAEWLFYILLILFYWKYSNLKNIYFICGFFTVLIVLGFLLSPSGISTFFSIVNRIIIITSMFLLSYFIFRERNIKKINTEIVDRISDLFLALTIDFNIVYMNKALADKTMQKDFLGKNIFDVFPHLKNTLYEEKLKEAISTQEPKQYRMSSPIAPFLYQVSVYPSSKGVSVFSKDVTALNKAEEKLRETLKEKEMLLREIHHRVKNNFQLVSSLLGLSAANIQDNQLRQTISILQNRIRTLALIHEKLYQSGNVSTINIQSFLKDLFNGLHQLSENKLEHLTTKLSVNNNINLHIQAAMPLGLIINELYTNSIKHAFDGKKECCIGLSLDYVNGNNSEIQILYYDNGKGFLTIPDLNNAETLGFTIISSFVEQINGKMIINNNGGAEFKINFKVLDE